MIQYHSVSANGEDPQTNTNERLTVNLYEADVKNSQKAVYHHEDTQKSEILRPQAINPKQEKQLDN